MGISEKNAIKAPLPNAIDQVLAHEIKILRLFFERRSLAIQKLFTETPLPSYMRDELIREVIFCFTQGQPLRVGTCQHLLERYGPSTLFKQELNLLKKHKLIFFEKDLGDPKEVLIRPTSKLVDFYRFQLPRLEADVREILNIPQTRPPALERRLRTEDQ